MSTSEHSSISEIKILHFNKRLQTHTNTHTHPRNLLIYNSFTNKSNGIMNDHQRKKQRSGECSEESFLVLGSKDTTGGAGHGDGKPSAWGSAKTTRDDSSQDSQVPWELMTRGLKPVWPQQVQHCLCRQTSQSAISQSLKGSLTRDMFLLESSPSSADSSLTCTLAVLLAVARDTLFTIGWAFSRAAHTGRITF